MPYRDATLFGGSIIRAFGSFALLAASLLLGAAASAQAPAPAAASLEPAQWGILPGLPGGECGAKAPAVDGVELSLALAPDHSVSILLAGKDWRIESQTYEIIMKLDDLPPFTFTMHGEGQALIGVVPRDFRAELLTAGKISFDFEGKDHTIAVHNLAGVVDRLDTCVEARRAAERSR